ncbi:unnamed protein product [Urochloa humidicola]
MATPRRARAYCLALVLVACILHHRAAAQPPLAVGEAELLLDMKRTWGDPPVLAEWSAAAGTHCHWPYVGCDSAGRVTSLALANTNIIGAIPDAVGETATSPASPTSTSPTTASPACSRRRSTAAAPFGTSTCPTTTSEGSSPMTSGIVSG